MFQFGMLMVIIHAAVSSVSPGSGQVAFHEDPFGAGFSGDAVFFISRTHAGEEMTILMADTPDLCDAIKHRRGNQSVRLWVAQVTQRSGDNFHIGVGSHMVLNDDDIYDDSFEPKGGVAMLAYMHKRAAAGRAPAFVGMAARGHLHITGLDRTRGDVTGDYHATFQLGYNKAAGGYLQAPSTGQFHATHCAEGPLWQQALLGADGV